MNFWVGVTDNSWFEYLKDIQPDEVNFWQPGGKTSFKALPPGGLFLFKLHSPLNFIVGGGFFVRHSFLPLSLAWEAFGPKNGAENLEDLRYRILHFRKESPKTQPDPIIGCIILAEPFFFTREEWISIPSDWRPNIVAGKKYDANEPLGLSLWKEVEVRLKSHQQKEDIISSKAVTIAENQNLYGADYLTRARLGQGAFRILVTESYNRRCAVTGERTLPVLEAAHIKPFAKSGPHKIDNGLLLRSDLHTLFDLGYMTITEDYHVEVSKRIREKYHNGREYYKMHGSKLISMPERTIERPSRDFIEWHNRNVYVA